MKRRPLFDLEHDPPAFALVSEAAGFLRVDRRTVMKLVDAGQLKVVYVFREVRISVKSLRAFVDQEGVKEKTGCIPAR